MIFFSAVVIKIGVNPCVNVPEEVMEKLFIKSGKKSGPIQIKGKLNGKKFIQTVVKYQGAWRLYLNGEMRKAASIDTGDVAEVQLAFDPAPRNFPVPPKLMEAFDKNKKVKSVFDKLSPSRQKEITRYLSSLKSAESVDRNIRKIISHLSGKESFAGRK